MESGETIDGVDRQLLALLQADNLLTAEQLSERVGRSPSVVARRLRRLRETGAVMADVSVVSERAAGQSVSAVVHIQLDRHSPGDRDRLRRRLVESPQVQLCLELAGSFDIMLLVVARDIHAYNAFADAALEENPAVRRFETTFVKRRVKATLAYPIEE